MVRVPPSAPQAVSAARPIPAAAGDLLIAGAFSVLALLIYLRTMYPDVTGGDAGEIIAAVASGGVIHPPGYPLYALLGKVFAQLPVGTLAWRFNLLSGVCDAAAGGALCLAASLWTRSRWAGVAAASLFAFSPGVWEYAVGAEVFALNNLFVAGLVLLGVLYQRTRDRRFAYAGALAFGLALSDHQTILFTGLPLSLWVLWTGRGELLQRKHLLRLSGLFLAGLLPYAEVVSAGAHPARVTWGATDTWSGFWTHFLRREYGTFRLSGPGEQGTVSRSDVAYAWAGDLMRQADWWGILLAALGLRACLFGMTRRPDRFGLVVLLPPFLAVSVFAILSQRPTDQVVWQAVLARFWQQPDIFVFLFCGYALAVAVRHLPWRPLAPAACVAVALFQPVIHYADLDHHADTIVRNYGTEILRIAPRGAMLVTRGDLFTFVLRYLQVAEGLRPDVRIVDQSMLTFPWDRRRLEAIYPEVDFPRAGEAASTNGGLRVAQFVDLNLRRFPLLLCGQPPDDDTLDSIGTKWPLGICDALVPRGQRVSVDAWVQESGAALTQIDFDHRVPAVGSWEHVVWEDYWAARIKRASALLGLAGDEASGGAYARQAASMLEEALQQNPPQGPSVLKVLAIARSHAGLTESPAGRRKAIEGWQQYLRVAPSSDPDLPQIEKEIARLAG